MINVERNFFERGRDFVRGAMSILIGVPTNNSDTVTESGIRSAIRESTESGIEANKQQAYKIMRQASIPTTRII
jgi:hypothetical protein